MSEKEFQSEWNPAGVIVSIIGFQMIKFDEASRDRNIQRMYEHLWNLYSYAKPAIGTGKAKQLAERYEDRFRKIEALVYHSENSVSQPKRTISWRRRYHERMNGSFPLLLSLRNDVYELLQAVGLYLPIKYIDDEKITALDKILRDEYGIPVNE